MMQRLGHRHDKFIINTYYTMQMYTKNAYTIIHLYTKNSIHIHKSYQSKGYISVPARRHTVRYKVYVSTSLIGVEVLVRA